jgi:hypothetical protein
LTVESITSSKAASIWKPWKNRFLKFYQNLYFKIGSGKCHHVRWQQS